MTKTFYAVTITSPYEETPNTLMVTAYLTIEAAQEGCQKWWDAMREDIPGELEGWDEAIDWRSDNYGVVESPEEASRGDLIDWTITALTLAE